MHVCALVNHQVYEELRAAVNSAGTSPHDVIRLYDKLWEVAEAMQTPEGAMAIASPDYRPWDKLQVLEEWYASRATKVKVSYFCDNFICI